MRAYRVEVIRRIEERAIAAQGVDTLMQRAAAAVAASASDLLRTTTGGRYGRHVLIMVGAGNNGGDA
jgi:NAD(P)H-hydrate repair Nnr-like enzyme with NAD(P)H-hydrate epimerase domain